MSDTFSDACMWYRDGYLMSGEEIPEHDMSIAKYFWESAVAALEYKLEGIIAEIKGMKGSP